MQPISGYASTAGDSITALAEQHGVSRESLLEFVRAKVQQTQQDGEQTRLDRATLERAISQTLDHAPQPPADDPAASPGDESVPIGYTSNARSVPARPAAAPGISVFA
jgi:hypothetical protein